MVSVNMYSTNFFNVPLNLHFLQSEVRSGAKCKGSEAMLLPGPLLWAIAKCDSS